MLVLSRKPGERILIGENIAITIVRVTNETVRVGIEAPSNTPVIREELILQETGLRSPKGSTCPAHSQAHATY